VGLCTMVGLCVLRGVSCVEQNLGTFENCERCKGEKVTEWKYEDDVCWVARCKSHPDKWMIVLRRHTAFPTQEEMIHLKEVALKLFPDKRFRGPRSVRDHFHWHEC